MKNKENDDPIKSYAESDTEYQQLLERLNKAYKADPILAKDSLKEMVSSAEREIRFSKEETEEPSFKTEDGFPLMDRYEIYRVVTMFLFIAAIGLLNIESIGMYIFGLVFFAAGLGVGLAAPAFGIIFLFSHGMTGLGIMSAALLGDLFNTPIMQDNPQNIYIYFGICVAIALVATLITIRKNLRLYPEGKEPKVTFIVGLYMVYFLLVALLPRLLPYIYNL